MKKIVGFLIAFGVWAQALPSVYYISQDYISSQEIQKNIQEFKIASFGDKFDLEIPAVQIEELFGRYGVKVRFDTQNVRFVYQTPTSLARIQEKIKQTLEQDYSERHLQIQNVILKPMFQNTQQKMLDVKWENKKPKKNRFVVLLVDEKGRENPFLCEVVGEMDVAVGLQDMRPGVILSSSNTQIKKVKFDSESIASFSVINGLQTRSFVRANHIIPSNKVKAVVVVKKGDLLDVVLQDGAVAIEGVLEAMANGSVGEEIIARNPQSKKNIKVKIIAKGKARVL
ncbi:flagella basal body P-ring formation protein FlgA [Helicobacter enhydrae]|uniref:Flagella basal body P-ring formation protein FlgA n=1 Tax=Helicobacter enhydrae TaxID=222136 RepID=A0A1B1U6S2_9HELI|nr:flagellar basal body P-ring formation chaperone FlgA [Helicobacter enhydrae]ANV98497.1 flagella basal body P-ring formation protein FlgA [Helicobacter enhydrae]